MVDGLGNTDRLTLNQTVFSSATIPGPRFGRGGGENQTTMIGNGGQDWYFTQYASTIIDLNGFDVVD